MRINFISVADETMASFRYHNKIPARELNKLGYEAFITPYPDFKQSDTYVFSKHLNYGDYWYAFARYGMNIIFHCCDNHFSTKHSEHYKRMIGIADKVICTTSLMAEIIKRETGKTAIVIPDTYELPEIYPCFKSDGEVHRPLKLLWYGHPSNLQDLIDALPHMEGHEVRVCTNPIKPWPGKLNTVQLMPYSPENILKAMDWCDAVVIPSSLDERKKVKSPNRLMEAIRRGKFVIANELPSYKEYSDFVHIGDIKEGINWLQEQSPDEIEDRVGDAQEYIKRFYSPERIGAQWEKALA